MPKQSLSKKCSFLHKANHSLLVLWNTRQYFNTTVGTVLDNEIINKKQKKKCKYHGTKKSMERYLFTQYKN